MLRGFWGYLESKNYGLYYWPYTEPYISKVPENPVYYPSSGYMASGTVNNHEQYLYSYTSNPNTTVYSYAFVHRRENGSIGVEGGSFAKSLALPVRCISYTKQNQ